ncbi:MAG TPA: hypothetical protein PLY53_15800 [Planctomycetota bacterium]|nr:hypothetical protein [Planctomycetota bacterium]
MEEGFNMGLALTSANFIGVLYTAVEVWKAKRALKIEQPLEVRNSEHHYNSRLCEQRHQSLAGQITDIYAKLTTAREGQAEMRGTLGAVKAQVDKIDGKIDTLLRNQKGG